MTASYLLVNDGSPLLKLPAELRLRIYIYALHAPEGVVCQAVRMHGMSCFYRYTLYRTSAGGSKPSKDVKATSSRHIASKPSKTIPAVSHTHELNQLKYVCREMYTETKGLIVANNNLIFEHGIDKFLAFAQTCPPSTLKSIRNVTIVDRTPPTSHVPGHKGNHAALIDFGEEYPKAEVQLRHSRPRPDSGKFFWHALRFDVHFRKNLTYVSMIQMGITEQIEALDLAIVSWGATQLDDIEAYPTNLRAYPPLGISLEEFLEKLCYDADSIPGGEFSA